jgi:hypothetical protein
MDISAHNEMNDKDWNTIITLKIKPDSRLSAKQRKVVADDYGMQCGVLTLRLRATLVQYALQQLGINDNVVSSVPEAQ